MMCFKCLAQSQTQSMHWGRDERHTIYLGYLSALPCLSMEGMDDVSAFFLGSLAKLLSLQCDRSKQGSNKNPTGVRNLETDKPRLHYQLSLAHSLS